MHVVHRGNTDRNGCREKSCRPGSKTVIPKSYEAECHVGDFFCGKTTELCLFTQEGEHMVVQSNNSLEVQLGESMAFFFGATFKSVDGGL